MSPLQCPHARGALPAALFRGVSARERAHSEFSRSDLTSGKLFASLKRLMGEGGQEGASPAPMMDVKGSGLGLWLARS